MRDVTGPLGELPSEIEQVEIVASNPSPVDTESEDLLDGPQGLSDTPEEAGNPLVQDKFLTDKGQRV